MIGNLGDLASWEAIIGGLLGIIVALIKLVKVIKSKKGQDTVDEIALEEIVKELRERRKNA